MSFVVCLVDSVGAVDVGVVTKLPPCYIVNKTEKQGFSIFIGGWIPKALPKRSLAIYIAATDKSHSCVTGDI